MEVATIVPTHYLYLTSDDTYFMALAHLVGVDKQYTEFFKKQAKLGKYVILDNGVIEGSQCTIESIVDKAQTIGASEIILPDVFKDMKETLKLSYEALNYCMQQDVPFKLMAVPQGNTVEEWMKCADEMIEWSIDCIGIPKVLALIGGFYGRLKAVGHIYPRVTGKDIHLLGCWFTPLEVNTVARQFKIRGVDSVIAYAYAKEGRTLLDGERPQFKIDFSDIRTDSTLLWYNIGLWRECCTDGVL